MNSEIIKSVFMIAGAYLLGSIPFGYIIGKANGVDVRTVGSKNIGATNVTRTVGKWAGKLCFACDFLKGALPVLAAQFCLGAVAPWVVLVTMLAAIAGHIFPIFLGFKGGKGVSTAAGAVMALAPLPLVVAMLVWLGTFLVSRYVSLASITAAAILPIAAWLFSVFEIGSQTARDPATLIFLIVIAVLAILRHHANIKRLLNGTENRFGKREE